MSGPVVYDAEAMMLQYFPQKSARAVILRALAQARERRRVAVCMLGSVTTWLIDDVMVMDDGTIRDCSDPTSGFRIDLASTCDRLGLDAHDRAVVAGFVAAMEGLLAAEVE